MGSQRRSPRPEDRLTAAGNPDTLPRSVCKNRQGDIFWVWPQKAQKHKKNPPIVKTRSQATPFVPFVLFVVSAGAYSPAPLPPPCHSRLGILQEATTKILAVEYRVRGETRPIRAFRSRGDFRAGAMQQQHPWPIRRTVPGPNRSRHLDIGAVIVDDPSRLRRPRAPRNNRHLQRARNSRRRDRAWPKQTANPLRPTLKRTISRGACTPVNKPPACNPTGGGCVRN